MIITGRLTGDAKVHELKDERKVVNFSIAINDRFKTKAGEQREVTTYVDCAYWQSPKVAEWLKKGTVVELYGRIGVDAYVKDGNAVGKLTCHTNNIKFLASSKRTETAGVREAATETENVNAGEKEDLPF